MYIYIHTSLKKNNFSAHKITYITCYIFLDTNLFQHSVLGLLG